MKNSFFLSRLIELGWVGDDSLIFGETQGEVCRNFWEENFEHLRCWTGDELWTGGGGGQGGAQFWSGGHFLGYFRKIPSFYDWFCWG